MVGAGPGAALVLPLYASGHGDSTSGHRYDYSQLQQPWEDEEHFYLTLDQKIWHILNKSQFTKGDPDQFAAFLAEQTGKAVRWVDGEKARRGVAL